MSNIRRQADRRKASKWEMYAGSDRLQRWQTSSKIRRQTDVQDRKGSKKREAAWTKTFYLKNHGDNKRIGE
jgi:hypothetical protein